MAQNGSYRPKYAGNSNFIKTGMRNFMGLFSRTDRRVMNNLGKVKVQLPKDQEKRWRRPSLEILDAYYEARQYMGMAEWDNSCAADGSHVPIRNRAPRLQMAFAKVMAQRVGSKLAGQDQFPNFKIEDDPQTTEYLRAIIRASQIKSKILEPVRRSLAAGSVLVRFFFVEGKIQIEHYLSKYCYPVFNAAGELQSVRVQYITCKEGEYDKDGNPVERWYRLDLGPDEDIEYDQPVYKPDEEPSFTVVNRVQHGLGFVQAEWMRTMEIKDSPDGYSLHEDILDFIDEFNYSLSQSSTAVSYNQDPQLILNKMDEEEVSTLVKSAAKAWNLGREGSAQYLETNLGSVERAGDLRGMVRLHIQDIARVVLIDPDKAVAQAQSAKAMEVLHGPMIELVKELRPMYGQSFKNIVLKLAVTNLILIERGDQPAVFTPPGYRPQSLDLIETWPAVFPMTLEDLQKKVSTTVSAVNARLISQETGTTHVAKDFGVEDVELERQKIDAQPVFNPFGGF